MKVEREDPPVVRARKWAERWEGMAGEPWIPGRGADECEWHSHAECQAHRARALLWRREVAWRERNAALVREMAAQVIRMSTLNLQTTMAMHAEREAATRPPSFVGDGHRVAGLQPMETVLDRATVHVGPGWPDGRVPRGALICINSNGEAVPPKESDDE